MNIAQIIEKLKAYKPESIILFGSYAEGTASDHSDLDIAIIKDTSKPFQDRLIEVRRLVKTTTPIDFFVFTKDEIKKQKDSNPFIEEIVKKGKVIYGQ